MLGLLVSACGGGPADQPSAPVVAPGAARLLLAGPAGLSEIDLQVGSDRPVRLLVRFSDNSFILDPALSPDGSLIAFVRQPPAKSLPNGSVDFGTDLYVVGRDGKDPRLIVKHADVAEFIRSPAWVSAGELLFAVRGRTIDGLGDFRIEKIDLQTLARSRVAQNAVDPFSSPDGKRVLFIRLTPETGGDELDIAGPGLTNSRKLVDNLSGIGAFSATVFSPDGTKVAFAALDLSPPTPTPAPTSTPVRRSQAQASLRAAAAHPILQDIWLVNTDGTGLRRLVELGEGSLSLAWSGDGDALYALGQKSFWRVDPRSGVATEIGPGAVPGQISWIGSR